VEKAFEAVFAGDAGLTLFASIVIVFANHFYLYHIIKVE
jgi:hypothetical protein